MDFSQITTNTREVEFVVPGAERTGFFLSLRYESAEPVQKVQKRYRHKMMEAQRKGKRGNQDQLMAQYEVDRLVAHVAGWRWAEDSPATWHGERPEFSEQLLRDMLSSGEFGVLLKDFISEEIGDAADFLPTSNSA